MNQTLLRRASRLFGLQTSYQNVFNETVWASDAVLVRTLQDLTRTKITSNDDLRRLITDRLQQPWRNAVPSTLVGWGGKGLRFRLYASHEFLKNLAISAKAADGATGQALANQATHPLDFTATLIRNSERGSIFEIAIETSLPLGYHVITVENPQHAHEIYCICPPEKLETPKHLKQTEGPFIPLYALRTGTEIGMGSLRELKKIAAKLHQEGNSWIATLPLLAGNFDAPDCDPSPYSAITRLFWNELYIDLEEAVQHYGTAEAKDRLGSNDFQTEAKRLRELDYADYHATYQLKKSVLKILAKDFFEQGDNTTQEFKAFAAENPAVHRYAAFRSSEREEQQFHIFAQFEMCRQLRDFQKSSPVGLYLDFPVGVTDAGFDFHDQPEIFFKEVSVGAPPEPVFQNGQDWGFPAFHPARLRATRYTYFQQALRNHLRFGRLLRLDHVMGLFRVYCIPKGWSAKDGVYLRFPPEDLFAIAILEAHLAGCDFIGENLGTVPPEVNALMQKRGIKGMWVLEMEFAHSPEKALTQIPETSLACMNTHDMPMLAAFAEAKDLPQSCELGILAPRYLQSFTTDRLNQAKPWTEKFGAANGGELARNVSIEIRSRNHSTLSRTLKTFGAKSARRIFRARGASIQTGAANSASFCPDLDETPWVSAVKSVNGRHGDRLFRKRCTPSLSRCFASRRDHQTLGDENEELDPCTRTFHDFSLCTKFVCSTTHRHLGLRRAPAVGARRRKSRNHGHQQYLQTCLCSTPSLSERTRRLLRVAT
ncbi:MAG: 4-alpha-glucanotransferase [Bdellovibrionales bacterium]|nr:4-alpha-glucanotransferase [Bdellovibrionales bacterium]